MNNKSTELLCGCPRQDEYSMCINQSHLGNPAPSESWEVEFTKLFVKDVNGNGSYLCVVADPKPMKDFISQLIAKAKTGLEKELVRQRIYYQDRIEQKKKEAKAEGYQKAIDELNAIAEAAKRLKDDLKK